MSGRWRVHSLDYAQFSDGRPHQHIGLPEGFKKWHAWEPEGEGRGLFLSHGEAITYAHEQATRQALAARFNIPPENPVARAMQEPTC